MRRALAALILILATTSAWGQFGTPARRVVAKSSLPATCTSTASVVDVVYLTSGSIGVYVCAAPNTWVLSGGTGGSGSVTSVAATVPSFMAVSGSPITISGTLAFSFGTQTANKFLASAASGGAAVPSFRVFDPLDFASIPASALSNGVTGSGAIVLAAGPTLTGDPIAPTPLTADDDTSIATTAFVKAQSYVPGTRTISTTAPLTGGGDLSANRTLAISDFVGDSGAGGTKGAVPAPAAGDAAAGKFLKADGTWAAAGGAGSAPFSDATGIVMNSADNTKIFQISASGITTGNTVTAASPIATGSFTFARQDAAQTFTGDQKVTGNAIASSGLVIGTGLTTADHKIIWNTIPTPNRFDFFNGDVSINVDVGASSFRASSSFYLSDTVRLNGVGTELNVVNAGATSYLGVKSSKISLFGSGSTQDTGFERLAAGVAASTDTAGGAGWIQNKAGRCFLASDYTNATASFTSITGCSITVKSGRKYTFRAVLFAADSVAGEGAQFNFNGGTATATDFRVHCTLHDTALLQSVQATALATAFTQATMTGASKFSCEGSFEPSANGTFIMQARQDTHSTGTLTVNRGSHIWFEDMP